MTPLSGVNDASDQARESRTAPLPPCVTPACLRSREKRKIKNNACSAGFGSSIISVMVPQAAQQSSPIVAEE